MAAQPGKPGTISEGSPLLRVNSVAVQVRHDDADHVDYMKKVKKSQKKDLEAFHIMSNIMLPQYEINNHLTNMVLNAQTMALGDPPATTEQNAATDEHETRDDGEHEWAFSRLLSLVFINLPLKVPNLVRDTRSVVLEEGVEHYVMNGAAPLALGSAESPAALGLGSHSSWAQMRVYTSSYRGKVVLTFAILLLICGGLNVADSAMDNPNAPTPVHDSKLVRIASNFDQIINSTCLFLIYPFIPRRRNQIFTLSKDRTFFVVALALCLGNWVVYGFANYDLSFSRYPALGVVVWIYTGISLVRVLLSLLRRGHDAF